GRPERTFEVTVDLKGPVLVAERGAERHAVDPCLVGRSDDEGQRVMRTDPVREEECRARHRPPGEPRRVFPRERAYVSVLEGVLREETPRESTDPEDRRSVGRGERAVERRRRAAPHVVEVKDETGRHTQVRRHRRHARGSRNAGGSGDDESGVEGAEQTRSAHRLPIVEAVARPVNHLKGLRREYYG